MRPDSWMTLRDDVEYERVWQALGNHPMHLVTTADGPPPSPGNVQVLVHRAGVALGVGCELDPRWLDAIRPALTEPTPVLIETWAAIDMPTMAVGVMLHLALPTGAVAAAYEACDTAWERARHADTPRHIDVNTAIPRTLVVVGQAVRLGAARRFPKDLAAETAHIGQSLLSGGHMSPAEQLLATLPLPPTPQS